LWQPQEPSTDTQTVGIERSYESHREVMPLTRPHFLSSFSSYISCHKEKHIYTDFQVLPQPSLHCPELHRMCPHPICSLQVMKLVFVSDIVLIRVHQRNRANSIYRV
jgi:hypothetical protein